MAGAVEYIECVSAEGYGSSTIVLIMTLNSLMVRLQKCWSLENVVYPFIAFASRFTWPGVAASERVLSMAQIELFNI